MKILLNLDAVLSWWMRAWGCFVARRVYDISTCKMRQYGIFSCCFAIAGNSAYVVVRKIAAHSGNGGGKGENRVVVAAGFGEMGYRLARMNVATAVTILAPNQCAHQTRQNNHHMKKEIAPHWESVRCKSAVSAISGRVPRARAQ
jgi:hypothetical protein